MTSVLLAPARWLLGDVRWALLACIALPALLLGLRWWRQPWQVAVPGRSSARDHPRRSSRDRGRLERTPSCWRWSSVRWSRSTDAARGGGQSCSAGARVQAARSADWCRCSPCGRSRLAVDDPFRTGRHCAVPAVDRDRTHMPSSSHPAPAHEEYGSTRFGDGAHRRTGTRRAPLRRGDAVAAIVVIAWSIWRIRADVGHDWSVRRLLRTGPARRQPHEQARIHQPLLLRPGTDSFRSWSQTRLATSRRPQTVLCRRSWPTKITSRQTSSPLRIRTVAAITRLPAGSCG